MFQSSPGPRAGSNNGKEAYPRRSRSRFNPLPAREPGATCASCADRSFHHCFNPLPAREPGATRKPPSPNDRSRRFNPLPAREPGATGVAGTECCTKGVGFNPLPAREPGATHCVEHRNGTPHSVSILSRPASREQRPTPDLPLSRSARFNPLPAREPGATSRCSPSAPCH